MNRYRTIPGLGPQKATASTVCQKCLKKDMTTPPHDLAQTILTAYKPLFLRVQGEYPRATIHLSPLEDSAIAQP